MCHNKGLTNGNFSSLEEIEADFLAYNIGLKKGDFRSLGKTGREHVLNDLIPVNNFEFFLSRNEDLIEINMPNAPKEVKERLSKIIEANLEKLENRDKSIVTPKDIARLDKESRLTTSEIDSAGERMNEIIRENDREEI